MPLTEMKNTIGIDKNIFIRCPICSNKIRTKLYHSTVLDKKSKKLQTKCATLKAPEKRAFSLPFVHTVFSYTVYPLPAKFYTAIYTAIRTKKGDPPKRADPLK